MGKTCVEKSSSSIKKALPWRPKKHYDNIWRATNKSKRLSFVKDFLSVAPGTDTPLSEGFTALMLCSMKDDVASMAVLVCAGADCEARSQSGQTALMLAAVCEAKAAVRWLLESGADACAVDADGDDVLQRGMGADVDLLSDLVQAGADPRKTCRGRTRRSILEETYAFGQEAVLDGKHKLDALDAFSDKVEIKNILAAAPQDQAKLGKEPRKVFRL